MNRNASLIFLCFILSQHPASAQNTTQAPILSAGGFGIGNGGGNEVSDMLARQEQILREMNQAGNCHTDIRRYLHIARATSQELISRSQTVNASLLLKRSLDMLSGSQVINDPVCESEQSFLLAVNRALIAFSASNNILPPSETLEFLDRTFLSLINISSHSSSTSERVHSHAQNIRVQLLLVEGQTPTPLFHLAYFRIAATIFLEHLKDEITRSTVTDLSAQRAELFALVSALRNGDRATPQNVSNANSLLLSIEQGTE